MPRPKYGLGQGLEALVSPRQRPGGWPETEPLSHHTEAAGPTIAPEAAGWEYARLETRRGRKKSTRKLVLLLSHPEINVRPRRRRVRGVSPWTALGMLGADGWELVSVQRRAFVFKRALAP